MHLPVSLLVGRAVLGLMGRTLLDLWWGRDPEMGWGRQECLPLFGGAGIPELMVVQPSSPGLFVVGRAFLPASCGPSPTIAVLSMVGEDARTQHT